MTDHRRRAFLATAGAAATAALAGCAGLFDDDAELETETERPPPDDDGGGTPSTEGVNVQRELEARGETVVNDILREAEDGARLYFPPGEYVIEESLIIRDVAGLTIVGDDATITPSRPVDDDEYLLSLTGEDIHVEGLTFDYRRPGYGGRFQIIGRNDFVCRDIEVLGENAARGLFIFEVDDPEGTGLVERLTARDGGPRSDGLFVGKEHAGELIVRGDCRLDGFTDGLYASTPGLADGGGGVVTVEGGEYCNNNIANVRLGSNGSSVTGATVLVDSELPPAPSGAINSRGIWLHGGEDLLVDGCTVTLAPPARGDGAIVMASDTISATVRDTDIVVDAGFPAISVIPLRSTFDAAAVPFQCVDVDISGAATGGYAVNVNGRDRCRFERMNVSQSGDRRGGFRFQQSTMNVIRNVDIDVVGEAVELLDDSTVDIGE